MYKEIPLSSNELVSEMFIASSMGLTELGGPLIKTASVSDLSSEIQRALKELQYDSDKFIYLVLVALGAGEYWGMNRNGDYFTEKGLKKNYKSYEVTGYVYSHHQNKDPKKSLGKVIRAGWNDLMKRVELIVEIDKGSARERAPDFLEAVESGKFPDVSMGVKAPYDQCSICGNKATKISEYCEHLKFQKGQILPDGRQIYAITEDYSFFDISFVTRGADPTAKTLLKVASATNTSDYTVDKLAELRKEAPATFLGSLVRKSLNPDDIEIVHSKIPEVPEEDVLKSMLLLGRIPTEQNLELIFNKGLLKSAEELPPLSSLLKVAASLSQEGPKLTQRQIEKVLTGSYGSVFKSIVNFFIQHKDLSAILIGSGLGALLSRLKGRLETGPTKSQQMERASMTPQEMQAFHAAQLQNTRLYGPYSVVKNAEDLEDLQLFTELLES